MLARYHGKGLRLIEVDKADLTDLPDIADRLVRLAVPLHRLLRRSDVRRRRGRLQGAQGDARRLDRRCRGNVVIYATSNRRHLLPEYFAENLETKHIGEEVHPGESVEEKISLSERFGLWISFYPFAQDDYLAAVDRLARAFRRQGDRVRARCRGAHARSAAVRAAARIAQRPRRVAVRAPLGGRPRTEARVSALCTRASRAVGDRA